MAEEPDYFACTDEQGMRLEFGVALLNHLVAKGCPRVGMDWEEDENLERMKSPEGGSGWISRNNEARQLHEAATLKPVLP